MAVPFIGREALDAGRLTRHRLRTHFEAVFPGVYVPAGVDLSAVARAQAAYLWTGREGVVDHHLPPPQPQIPVYDAYGGLIAELDMGWEGMMIALDYEGDHHRTTRQAFNKGIRRHDAVTELGWNDIRVTSADSEGGVIA